MLRLIRNCRRLWPQHHEKKGGTSGKKKPPKFGRPTAKEWAAHKPPHTARSSWVLAFATRGGRGLPSRSNASHDELCRPSPDACQTFTGRSRREDVALGCARERSWFHPGDASIPVSRRQDTELGAQCPGASRACAVWVCRAGVSPLLCCLLPARILICPFRVFPACTFALCLTGHSPSATQTYCDPCAKGKYKSTTGPCPTTHFACLSPTLSVCMCTMLTERGATEHAAHASC